MKVTQALDELILRLVELGYEERDPMLVQSLAAAARKTEAEHRWRMEQCRRETRRAFARYLRSVIADYLKGTKRTVPRRAQALPVGGDRYRCTRCDEPISKGQRYCASCGARVKWPKEEVKE